MYSVINYQKWKSCSSLENDVFKCITELYPINMLQLAKLTQILKYDKEDYKEPIYRIVPKLSPPLKGVGFKLWTLWNPR